MIQHIRKSKIIIITTILFAFFCNCKNNDSVSKQNDTVVTKIKDSNSIVKTEIGIEENNSSNINNTDSQYKLDKIFFYKADGSIIPQVSNEDVINHFKNIKIDITDTQIKINNITSNYEISESETKRIFSRKYEYNNRVSSYKEGFGIDISKKMRYIELDAENNYVSPFLDYFEEGGIAIFIDNILYLNYKSYIISFVKNDNEKISKSDLNLFSLPIEYEKLKNTNLSKFYIPENMIPLIYTKIIEKTSYKPDFVIKLKNNMDFDTYLVEYSGDPVVQDIFNFKGNTLISNENVGYELGGEDKTYTTFKISNDLTIDVIEVKYSNNSKKVIAKYKIDKSGKINKH